MTAYLNGQLTQPNRDPFLQCCILGVREDQAVGVHVDDIRVYTSAFGLDVRDPLLHLVIV
jgi:hypothetical protein